jgi:hypothetical protein
MEQLRKLEQKLVNPIAMRLSANAVSFLSLLAAVGAGAAFWMGMPGIDKYADLVFLLGMWMPRSRTCETLAARRSPDKRTPLPDLIEAAGLSASGGANTLRLN